MGTCQPCQEGAHRAAWCCLNQTGAQTCTAACYAMEIYRLIDQMLGLQQGAGVCLLPTLLCMPQNWLCCHLEQPSTTAEAFVLAAGCCDTFMESGMLHTAVHATKTSALIAVWKFPIEARFKPSCWLQAVPR